MKVPDQGITLVVPFIVTWYYSTLSWFHHWSLHHCGMASASWHCVTALVHVLYHHGAVLLPCHHGMVLLWHYCVVVIGAVMPCIQYAIPVSLGPHALLSHLGHSGQHFVDPLLHHVPLVCPCTFQELSRTEEHIQVQVCITVVAHLPFPHCKLRC